jgi:hypothetical protein
MINIKEILSKHGIFYVEQGPNTGIDEISIACKLCGDDPSQHCGINLVTGYWHCWRNPKHSGKNLVRLLQILGIPYVEEHKEILKKLLDRTLFEDEIKIPVEENIKKYTEWPIEFIPITDGSIFSKYYLNYLRNRGFENPAKVAEYYQLSRCIFANKWSTRLIIPVRVYDEVSWTGRAIGINELRYLSPTKEDPARNIKECIGNYNELINTRGAALTIHEGPLDMLKLDWYNKEREIRATCLFGLSASETQIRLLKEICPNFDNILIGLDQNTLTQSLDLVKRLRKFNPVIMNLPKKDIGEMSKDEINNLLSRYLS